MVCPSVAQSLQKNDFVISSELVFEHLKNGFCKVTLNTLSSSRVISALFEDGSFLSKSNGDSALKNETENTIESDNTSEDKNIRFAKKRTIFKKS